MQSRDDDLLPNPFNNHGIEWEALRRYVAGHAEKFGWREDRYGDVYLMRTASNEFITYEKDDPAVGWNGSTYFHPGDYIVYKTKRLSSGTESAWVYRKAPCPECGVETAWGIGIQHSRKRCRKCELELQRRWNRRAAKNYRVRNGLIHTPLYVTCQQCGKKFQPKRRTARFCSNTCRVKSHRRDVSALTTPSEGSLTQ